MAEGLDDTAGTIDLDDTLGGSDSEESDGSVVLENDEVGVEPDSPGAPAPPKFNDDWGSKDEEKGDAEGNAPVPPPAGLKNGGEGERSGRVRPHVPRKTLTVDEDLAEWVQEYLQYRGYDMTLDCFQAEYLSRQYSDSASHASNISANDDPSKEETRESIVLRSRRATMNKILDAFDVGNSERFTKLWETNIPLFVRREDSRVQKAYFLARVHFVARALAIEYSQVGAQATPSSPSPMSPSKKQRHTHVVERELERFKLYLEGEGGDVAGREASLERYPALLFVSNPRRHPSFQALFSGAGPVIRGGPRGCEGSGGNPWSKNIRTELASVIDDTLQHVPSPRLLQMYDAFMTGYASFGEQIQARRAAAEKARQVSKRLYRLSVKLAKDIVDDQLPEKGPDRSKYISNIRRELKNCREEIVAPTQLAKEAALDSGASTGSTTPSFLMGQPPSLDYKKVRTALDGTTGNEDEVAALLDALWWRVAQSSPPSLPGLVSQSETARMRRELRRNIASDLTDGDVLCLRKPCKPVISGSQQNGESNPLSQLLAYSSGRASPLQVAAIRFVDAISGWKSGREYLSLFPMGGLSGLAKIIFEIFSKGGLSSGAINEGETLLVVGRRHALSALQRLSADKLACETICGCEGSAKLVADLLLEGSKAKQPMKPDTGTMRFASALFLNMIVTLGHRKQEGSVSSIFDDENSLRDVADALCSILAMDAPPGRGPEADGSDTAQDDRWGRRYASAAMYAFVAHASVRNACTNTDAGA